MNYLFCLIRLIGLLVALSACSNLNKDVEPDSSLLEDISDEVAPVEECTDANCVPPRKLNKRRRHKFKQHLLIERVHTTARYLSLA